MHTIRVRQAKKCQVENEGGNMKHMKIKNEIKFLSLIAVLLIFMGCNSMPVGLSSSAATGATDTGSTDPGPIGSNDTDGLDASQMSARMGVVANALVPDISTTDADPSLSYLSFLTDEVSEGDVSEDDDDLLMDDVLLDYYGTEDAWADYIKGNDGNNIWLITDIFGDPDEAPAVVTKIRVLLDAFEHQMKLLYSHDPKIECVGAELLDEENTINNTIEVAFYGEIDNGTTEDRFFDCIKRMDNPEGDNNKAFILYGYDAEGVMRIVNMSEMTYNIDTTDQYYVPERGKLGKLFQVVMVTYAEDQSDAGTKGYLDLKYAQATIYLGQDEADPFDNVVFKSATSITGEAELDSDNHVISGQGDFSVTKYDRGVNSSDNSVWTQTTQTIGRGGYDDGDFSLFRINSTASQLEDPDQIFCLEHEEGALPSYTDGSNCASLVDDYPWTTEFPFDLEPKIEKIFAEKPFIEDDGVDMISDSGDNFAMPKDYKSKEVIEEEDDNEDNELDDAGDEISGGNNDDQDPGAGDDSGDSGAQDSED